MTGKLQNADHSLAPKRWELYHSYVTTQPTPEHPSYFEIEQAVVSMWIFALSKEDAARRSVEIVNQLTYEQTEAEVKVALASSVSATALAPEQVVARDAAKKVGFCFTLLITPPGSDD